MIDITFMARFQATVQDHAHVEIGNEEDPDRFVQYFLLRQHHQQQNKEGVTSNNTIYFDPYVKRFGPEGPTLCTYTQLGEPQNTCPPTCN